MISSVRGLVLSSAGTTVVVEVGGIGLAITVTPQHALGLRAGQEAMIRTALIVREDDLSLYGFAETEELEVFDLLRGVTGVGPKSALGVLAAMSPAEISRAVAVEDDAAFRKVSGIGPKTAKLIVLSLAGKLSIAAAPRSAPASKSAPTVGESVTIALVGLGWPERVAAQAVADALAEASAPDSQTVASLLRLSLASLGPRS